MKPVNSSIKHDPDNGLYGDCFRACIASVLEMELEEVPHFYDGFDGDMDGDAEYKINHAKNWVRNNTDYILSDIPILMKDQDGKEYSLYDASNFLRREFSGVHVILTGKSGAGDFNHSVVALNGRVVHDPNGSGVVGPCVKLDGEVQQPAAVWIDLFLAKV